MSGSGNRVATLFACLVAVALVSPAVAAAVPTSVEPTTQASRLQTANLSQPFDTPLEAVVRDENGDPAPGVTVDFEAPALGASATLSAPSAVTDANGVASVTATANGTGGHYFVTPKVTGIAQPTKFILLNLPPGYSPGEQLSNFVATDHAGTPRTVRDFLEGGRSFLLLDVGAGFCGPCRSVAAEATEATQELAALGIRVHAVPLLQVGNLTASTQADASAYRTNLHLEEPVLHTSGNSSSAAFIRAGFILRNHPPPRTPRRRRPASG